MISNEIKMHDASPGLHERTADLTTLLDRNRSFAEQFAAGDLKISPRMSTILLTCLDARPSF